MRIHPVYDPTPKGLIEFMEPLVSVGHLRVDRFSNTVIKCVFMFIRQTKQS